MKRTILIFLIMLIPATLVVAGYLAVREYFFVEVKPSKRPVKTLTYGFPEPTIDPPKFNPGTLIVGQGTPSTEPGSWPRFRGPNRTGIADAEEKLLRKWPADKPEILWKIDVGEGHAGVAVHNGRVYLIDYDYEKKEDAIRCLSLADGKEIWRYTYSVYIKPNHGMSRTVPSVTDKYVVAIGPMGHVNCLRADTGERVWNLDMVKDYGMTVPGWYAGQCALIDGDRAVIAPVGSVLMMSIDLASGNILWKVPNPDKWKMTHTSIVMMDYRGEKHYVYSANGGMVGIRAADGSVAWKTTEWKGMFRIPTPVVVGDDRLLVSAGYGKGYSMFRLSGEPSSITIERVQPKSGVPDPKILGSAQHTPILSGGRIHAIIPDERLVCLDLDCKQLYTTGKSLRFYLGPFIMADGLLLALSSHKKESGTLYLIEPTADEYRVLAKAKLFEAENPWAPMALANGKLILRDLKQLLCVKVGERAK